MKHNTMSRGGRRSRPHSDKYPTPRDFSATKLVRRQTDACKPGLQELPGRESLRSSPGDAQNRRKRYIVELHGLQRTLVSGGAVPASLRADGEIDNTDKDMRSTTQRARLQHLILGVTLISPRSAPRTLCCFDVIAENFASRSSRQQTDTACS